MAESKKRTNSSKKRTGSQNTKSKTKTASRQTRTRQTAEESDMGFFRAEVVIICSFAVAVLLFLSNFQLCGAVGQVLREVQLGLLGSVGFLLPILLFVGTCFYLSNRGNVRATVKLAAVVLASLTVCALLQLMFGAMGPDITWTDYYRLSAASGVGGGLAGGILASLLTAALGNVGAGLVLLVLLILSMVCITERSFVNAVRKGSGKVYRYAREDLDRRREVYAQRQEEIRREQEEQLEEMQRQEELREQNRQPVRHIHSEPAHRPVHPDNPADLPDVMGDESIETEQNYEDADEISRLASSLESHGKKSAQVHEPETSYMLHREEEESFRLPPNHRTFREMDFEEEEISFPPADDFPAESIPPRQEDPEDQPEALPAAERIQEVPSGVSRERSQEPERQEDLEDQPPESMFVVPDEPKQVVTASGKVIETETELLEKKLEQKRQEAAQENPAVQAVQEIKKQEEVKKEYIFPPLNLLKRGSRGMSSSSQNEHRATALKLQQTLRNFGVGVTITNISCGPTVTRYELLPEQGVKVSKIVGLADDIKLSLAAADIRIEAPIPGKSAVGIEVPNKENNVVYLRELLESDAFRNHKSSLAFGVGKDIGGQVVVADIAKMPHLLIAGATGSGKSVCINTLIMSIIYKSKPEDVRLILIDPKVVELSVYNGIPHLLIPVVTDPKKASGALNWAVAEMLDRYKKFAACNVRDLKGYNQRVENLKDIPDEKKAVKLPQIVIIIDELADLMMVAPGEVEESICRLAQLARAAGIHLVIATQRPSVNVITGLIKANVPSRIAFSVSSGVDSRTIIDMNGAEKLLGKGDMLFYPAGYPKPQRVQGAYVSDEEVSRVVEFLTQQGLTAQYSPDVESSLSAPQPEAAAAGTDSRDEYFQKAGQLIIDKEKASIGMLQRTFKIGFNRAARIMDQLAEAGVVGPEEGTKPRKILMTPEEFQEFLKEDQS